MKDHFRIHPDKGHYRFDNKDADERVPHARRGGQDDRPEPRRDSAQDQQIFGRRRKVGNHYGNGIPQHQDRKPEGNHDHQAEKGVAPEQNARESCLPTKGKNRDIQGGNYAVKPNSFGISSRVPSVPLSRSSIPAVVVTGAFAATIYGLVSLGSVQVTVKLFLFLVFYAIATTGWIAFGFCWNRSTRQINALFVLICRNKGIYRLNMKPFAFMIYGQSVSPRNTIRAQFNAALRTVLADPQVRLVDTITWLVEPSEAEEHFLIPPDRSEELRPTQAFVKARFSEVEMRLYGTYRWARLARNQGLRQALSRHRQLAERRKKKSRDRTQTHPKHGKWVRYVWVAVEGAPEERLFPGAPI